MVRLPLLVTLVLVGLALAGCAGGAVTSGESSPRPAGSSQASEATTTASDAASGTAAATALAAGKPVVYWIHTDW